MRRYPQHFHQASSFSQDIRSFKNALKDWWKDESNRHELIKAFMANDPNRLDVYLKWWAEDDRSDTRKTYMDYDFGELTEYGGEIIDAVWPDFFEAIDTALNAASSKF
jgi:hypothetical protein